MGLLAALPVPEVLLFVLEEAGNVFLPGTRWGHLCRPISASQEELCCCFSTLKCTTRTPKPLACALPALPQHSFASLVLSSFFLPAMLDLSDIG